MTDVRVAVQLHPQHAEYADIRRASSQVEELGADVVYNWDHFYPRYDGKPDVNVGKHLECWTMLGAWAESTEKIKFGALVTCNSYRNPQLLADMARTVDVISGGRLIFGIGSGWFEKDYDEYGYEFGTAGGRLRALDAAMPIIVDRLKKLDPPPTGKLPILIGGGGEKVTLRIVGQFADIWHGFGSPETFSHKSAILDDWCVKAGREPSEVERSVSLEPKFMDKADEYVAAGAHELVLALNGPDYDMGSVRELISWRDSR